MAYMKWTGGAGDNRLSTDGNWVTPSTGTSAAPGVLDTIAFPPDVGPLWFSSDILTVAGIIVGGDVETDTNTIHFGPGITTSSITVHSGQAMWSGVTTQVIQEGGELTINTGDAITLLEVKRGRCFPDRHGTITGITVWGSGFVDMTRTTMDRIVTGITLQNPGARIRYNDTYVTVGTSGIQISYRGGIKATSLV